MRVAAAAYAILFVLFANGTAFAQGPNTGPGAATTENPQLSRQLDAKRAAARKAKRLDCERQAKEQKLHLAKRLQFIRRCMAGN
jgi:hypothetical protein